MTILVSLRQYTWEINAEFRNVKSYCLSCFIRVVMTFSTPSLLINQLRTIISHSTLSLLCKCKFNKGQPLSWYLFLQGYRNENKVSKVADWIVSVVPDLYLDGKLYFFLFLVMEEKETVCRTPGGSALSNLTVSFFRILDCQLSSATQNRKYWKCLSVCLLFWFVVSLCDRRV